MIYLLEKTKRMNRIILFILFLGAFFPTFAQQEVPSEKHADASGVGVFFVILFITIAVLVFLYFRHRSAVQESDFGSRQVDIWSGMMLVNSAGSGKSNYSDFINGTGIFAQEGHAGKTTGGGGVAGSW